MEVSSAALLKHAATLRTEAYVLATQPATKILGERLLTQSAEMAAAGKTIGRVAGPARASLKPLAKAATTATVMFTGVDIWARLECRNWHQ
jgi:hypothetical protein